MEKQTVEKGVLMVPLFAAFLWMGFLVLNVDNSTSGAQLSPTRLDTLINAIFVFIIIYAVLLVYMFFKMKHPKTLEKKLHK